jgi:hypothetical protein
LFLFYYDEVKFDPPVQPSFWLGGIAVKDSGAADVENQINALAAATFGSSILERGNEFHGIEIVQGKGTFKGVKLEERLSVFTSLLKITASDAVHRFYVRIRPENIVMTSDPPEEIAFMYYVEIANRFLNKIEEYGMMFGDYDEPTIGKSVVSLSKYKHRGTYWQKAAKIDRLIDTVHFAKSHHSRLIQLADVYLYAQQFYSYQNFGNWRDGVNKLIQESGILTPTACKVWPQERHWYR